MVGDVRGQILNTDPCDFSLLLQLVGAGLLGMGIWLVVDSGSLLSTLQHFIADIPELNQLANTGYLLIAVGTALALVGFLGCCGAMKESRCMLLTVSNL